MNRKTTHLTRNRFSGIYYFRLDIPLDIQPFYAIKTIKRSLGTNNKEQASVHVLSIALKYKLEFSRIRKTMPKKFIKLMKVEANGKKYTSDTGCEFKYPLYTISFEY